MHAHTVKLSGRVCAYVHNLKFKSRSTDRSERCPPDFYDDRHSFAPARRLHLRSLLATNSITRLSRASRYIPAPNVHYALIARQTQ